MPRNYLRWGGKNSLSQSRLKEQIEKAKAFSKGDKVIAGGRKGAVVAITDTGGIKVRFGNGTSQQYNPDHVEKQ